MWGSYIERQSIVVVIIALTLMFHQVRKITLIGKKNFINCYTTLDDDKGTLVQITLLFSTFSYFVVCLNIIVSGLSVISYIGHISYISYIRYQLYQLYQLYQIWNYVISLHRIPRKNNQTIHTTITVGKSVQLLHSLCGEERQFPMAA